MRAAAQFSYCAEMQIYFFCAALQMLVPVVGFARVFLERRFAIMDSVRSASSCMSRALEFILLGYRRVSAHLVARAQLRLLGNYMDGSARVF